MKSFLFALLALLAPSALALLVWRWIYHVRGGNQCGLFKLTLNMACGLTFIMATNKSIKPIIFLKLPLYIHFIFYNLRGR